MTSQPALQRSFTIRSPLGLHARPAGRFVSIASRFQSEIEVSNGGEWVSGRSVLSILSLAAGPGATLSIRAAGPDAADALEALGAVLESGEDSAAAN